MLAIDILNWPGFNQALLFSILVLVALIAVAVLYGKRRPVGKPLSWGEGDGRPPSTSSSPCSWPTPWSPTSG